MSTESDTPPSSDDPPEPERPPGRPGAPCDIVLQNPCQYREAGVRRHRPWIAPLIAKLAPAAETVVIRFVGNREMRRLNREFRGHDTTTDVLSFLGREQSHRECPPEARDGHLGDVAISVPEARRQASELGHGVERELRILMLHGLLHCLGYDHETDDGTMERIEVRWRGDWIDGHE